MLSFSQYISEARNRQFQFTGNGIYAIEQNGKFNYHHDGSEDYSEHEDAFPHIRFSYKYPDVDKRGLVKKKQRPTPMSFGRVDHSGKLFYIITKHGVNDPDYTGVRSKREIETDLFNRMNTARILVKKFPGYQMVLNNLVDRGPKRILSLPEYEKHLMSKMPQT